MSRKVGVPKSGGIWWKQTPSCFRSLLEHQSTTASLNTCWFLFPIHTSQRKRRDWRGNDSFLHSSQLLLEAVEGNSPAASLLTSEIRPWRALTHPMCYGPNNSKLLLGATSNSFSFDCCQLPFSCGSALRTSKTPPSISLIFFFFCLELWQEYHCTSRSRNNAALHIPPGHTSHWWLALSWSISFW